MSDGASDPSRIAEQKTAASRGKPSLRTAAIVGAIVTLAASVACGYAGVRFGKDWIGEPMPFYFGFWAMLVLAGLTTLFVIAALTTDFSRKH